MSANQSCVLGLTQKHCNSSVQSIRYLAIVVEFIARRCWIYFEGRSVRRAINSTPRRRFRIYFKGRSVLPNISDPILFYILHLVQSQRSVSSSSTSSSYSPNSLFQVQGQVHRTVSTVCFFSPSNYIIRYGASWIDFGIILFSGSLLLPIRNITVPALRKVLNTILLSRDREVTYSRIPW